MKFFLPLDISAEETSKFYKAIKAHLCEELGARFNNRKVRYLQWMHGCKKYQAAVGEITSFNDETVIAILYESGRNLYHVCTPNRGVFRGTSILVGGHSAKVVSDFAKGRMAIRSWWAGKNSGCPFCAARNQELPKIGEKIRFLAGYRAGKVGIVVECPLSLKDKLESKESIVEIDGGTRDFQERFNGYTEIFERLPGTVVPAWAPPIFLRDAAELEPLIIRLCDEISYNENGFFNIQFFYDLIHHVWAHRLPIESDEIWNLLKAHGAPSRWEKPFIRQYREGRDLLIHVVGRKPIKKKRVSPLSI